MLELRPYQVEASNAYWDRLWAGVSRGIINLPTGTGKTVLAATMARQLGGRTLWIAHRDELIEQPKRTFAVVWPEATVGVVKAERNETDAQVVLATIQTIYRPKRLEQLGQFDFIVVDEAHHAVAPTWIRTLRELGAFSRLGPPTLGLTATVERGDQLAIGEAFQEVVYQLPLLEAIRKGWLVDLLFMQIKLVVNFDDIPLDASGDFDAVALHEALKKAKVADAVAEAYLRNGGGRKALVFTVSVEQARLTAEALQARGVAAEWVSGETPLAERRRALERLHTGETRVLANCAVLTEGFDEPSVSCVVVARPTRSKTLYLQMIGRGTRLYPGKDDCLIVDVSGSSRKHTIIQAPVLFGLPLAVESDTPKSLSEAIEQAGARHPTPEERLLKASHTWESRRRFHWIVDPETSIRVLPAGKAHGNLAVVPAGPKGFEVWVIPPNDSPKRLLDRRVWLELAQGIAEDYVRRVDALWVAEPGRAWRAGWPTEAQLEAARKWGIKVDPSWKQGELSDRITLASARAGLRKIGKLPVVEEGTRT